MKQLKVEIPDFVHKKLKQTALDKNISLRQLVIHTLMQMLVSEKMIE